MNPIGSVVEDSGGGKDRQTLRRRESRRMRLLKRAGLYGTQDFGAQITRATTLADLRAAYMLVHDMFVERGYIRPIACGMRVRVYEALPEMATFVAKVDGQVVGVQSLVPDAEDVGLPSDESFAAEIDALRTAGRTICEATNQAVASAYRKSSIPTELMRCMFAQAAHDGCSDLITAVSQTHAPFYKLMGFEPIGPVRSYSKEIEDPVVLMRLDFDTIAPRAAIAETGAREDDAFLISYYLNDNPYRGKVGAWSVAAEATFSNDAVLRELFVTATNLLDRCTPDEREAILRRWGCEALDRVIDVAGAAQSAGRSR